MRIFHTIGGNNVRIKTGNYNENGIQIYFEVVGFHTDVLYDNCISCGCTAAIKKGK